MPNILIVEDEAIVRAALREQMEAAGHTVLEADTGAAALERFAEGADVVLLDYMLPDTDGLALLEKLRAIDPEPPIIMLTGHASVASAVEAMKLGAHYYTSKPVDPEAIAVLVGKALDATHLGRQVRTLLARERDAHGISNIIGMSEAIQAVKAVIVRVADRATTVLISGESGTGKDLIARALHAQSSRAGGPLINVTCSALPETLLENELFGHERGAYTDARQMKKGLLEQASGGTVFLDEIGDVSLGVQAKLLRFLEEKAFRRLGGTTDVRPDVRIVAATNRDLPKAVRAGTFREDLLYRLTVVNIVSPPLRERIGDVDLLLDYFVDRFNKELGSKVTEVSPAARRMLNAHAWPGNVRELRNVVERAMLLTDSNVLDVGHFQLARPVREASSAFELPPEGLDFRALERDLVVQALRRTNGNQSRAATLLGMSRDQIRHRMAKFGIVSDLESEAKPS